MDLFRELFLAESRCDIFEEAFALTKYTFARDNGTVPQLQHARKYVDRWNQMQQENMGLLFWGPTGSGKTYAAACIANALFDEYSMEKIVMTTLGTVLNKLPAMSIQDKDYYLKKLRTCELLILDDFGMERQTDYAREQVFGIIDGRYTAGRPMIVTTNLTLKELKNPSDMAARRICDRLLEMCVPVCFDRPSLRPEKAKDKLRRYKELTAD